MAEEGEQLTSEEIATLTKDINDAKKVLSSKDTEEALAKAKQAGKEEAEKEIKLKQEIEQEKARTAVLEEKLKNKELEASTELEKLQKRVNELASSKGVISPPNANQNPTGAGHPIDKMTEEQINEIEENSAREFFGPTWNSRA